MRPKAQAAGILVSLLTVGVLGLAGAGPAGAAPPPRTWMNHASPYSFLFGNPFDNYQETRLNNDGTLSGFLYVQFTGETTSDGYRVAIHNNCPFLGGLCQAGWTVQGRAGNAGFANQAMFSRDAIWHVKAGEVPQPGSYSFFSRLGTSATTEMTCPVMESALSATPPPPTQGYFLQLTATQSFCFRSDPTNIQLMTDMMLGQMQRMELFLPGTALIEQMLFAMSGAVPTMQDMMLTMEHATGYGPPGPVNPSLTCKANGGYPVVDGVDIASHTNFFRGM